MVGQYWRHRVSRSAPKGGTVCLGRPLRAAPFVSVGPLGRHRLSRSAPKGGTVYLGRPLRAAPCVSVGPSGRHPLSWSALEGGIVCIRLAVGGSVLSAVVLTWWLGRGKALLTLAFAFPFALLALTAAFSFALVASSRRRPAVGSVRNIPPDAEVGHFDVRRPPLHGAMAPVWVRCGAWLV